MGHDSRRQLVVLGEAVEKIAIFETTHFDHGVYELPRAVQGESAVSLARNPANCHVKPGGGAPIECELGLAEPQPSLGRGEI